MHPSVGGHKDEMIWGESRGQGVYTASISFLVLEVLPTHSLSLLKALIPFPVFSFSWTAR